MNEDSKGGLNSFIQDFRKDFMNLKPEMGRLNYQLQ